MKTMKRTTLLFLLSAASLLCGSSQRVGVTVSPSRSQFFEGESVILNCEDDSSAGWTLRRNSSEKKRTQCDEWGEASGSSCTISYMYEEDNGVYWCESRGGGASSMVVNISVSVNPESTTVFLLDPAPPPAPPPRRSVFAVVHHLLVICPYFISTLLMASLCRRRAPGKDRSVSMVTARRPAAKRFKEDGDDTALTTEHHF
ncbi:hypothetical protein FQA47_004144 [Oryzias melastigma]|uniref:Ig-like domain-containing protein n=1 Tax=Oryzias melastigma TaxID=30732 RepID=A0A834CKK7_ORYME|nr:hypothetical protein FQA47_004144 [Oryzias melastigma]